MPGAPLIGVTAGHVPSGARVLDAIDREYGRAVQLAGGAPVLLPATTGNSVADIVGHLDGLLLTGGGDVDPARYGAVPGPAVGGVDADRDQIELEVLHAALERGLPVLGVCRGCQLLNVALGGTLHQHLPDLTGLGHLFPEPRDTLTHQVAVEPGSLLRSVVGSDELPVNSIHHQAVDRLAPGLRAVACAPDGIIEGVEDPERALLAVQWHPESLVPGRAHLALFRWLTGRAAQRAG